jgi:inhibitor of KinA
MTEGKTALSLQPLGDQAWLASFADEDAAAGFAELVRAAAPEWVVDVVQAYHTVAVFFDADRINLGHSEEWLRARLLEINTRMRAVGRLHVIPCCYEMHLDLERVATWTKLPPDEVIRLHTSCDYTVYAIGFCPGFPYLGYLPPAISGVPRLESPRRGVEVGSVGLTGRQTGIYTEPRPGGWNLIGRTPLQLVDVKDGYFPLRTGDRVRFQRIDAIAFREMQGRRLPVTPTLSPSPPE